MPKDPSQDALARWLTENRQDASELARTIRTLVAAAVSALAPPEVLQAARTKVAEAAALLEPHVPGESPARYPRVEQVGDPSDVMPFDPVMGPLSPLAPPLAFSVRDGTIVAEACFQTPYEGPPGCVHGGIIAACFDQVLNVANLMAGIAGPTASLSLRYRRPTPLRAPVAFEAGQPVHSEGRVRTTGVLRAGREVCVEAEGVFVPLALDRIMALTSGRR